ncbi:hypothetical protein [Actinoplanes friuliensis]|nr:hypothetical protein [Actinoplanes friuliensis]
MIPTLMVLGLVLGRWWRTTLVVATVGWPLLLLADGISGDYRFYAGSAALGLANTAIGVIVHQAILWCVRHLRHSDHGRSVDLTH